VACAAYDPPFDPSGVQLRWAHRLEVYVPLHHRAKTPDNFLQTPGDLA
jgi:hypothetical protein